jgi:poly-gamma-glutamate capsule biosynthesis protein CapA/YwtB (metallophosphatase superfamily)
MPRPELPPRPVRLPAQALAMVLLLAGPAVAATALSATPARPAGVSLAGAPGQPWGAPRGTVLADFESGQVTLESFEDQDQEPAAWSLSSSTTYGESQYALRLSGNTWKAQPITGYALTGSSVLQVAAYVSSVGETQGFGVSDGVNTLFYAFAGTQLFTEERWEAVYQGAFAPGQWNLYLLPVGRDRRARYGYDPVVTRLVYCNDRDAGSSGVIYFDDIVDLTTDLPQAPQVQIVRGRSSVQPLAERLFRVGIQFLAQVTDPDTPPEDLTYDWDFGDGSVSTSADPYHDFLVQADHPYTVTLEVRDPQGMRGRDSTRVTVDPGPSGLPATMNFVGDVMLARTYDNSGGLIDQHGPEWMFIPTRPVFGDDADLNVCNLECPLTDEGTRHPTKSITFRGRPANVAGLTYAGIDLVSLANNHITDYGQRGMEETQEVLDAAGIPWYGADDGDYGAIQPVFRGVGGVSLAFIGQCNRTGREYNYQPFLDAGFNKPGFAWETEANLDRALASTLPYSDLTVMQLHSGIEYATGPGARAGSQGGAPGASGVEWDDRAYGAGDGSLPAAWTAEPWDASGRPPAGALSATARAPGAAAGFYPADDPPPPPPYEGDEAVPSLNPPFRFPTRPSLSDRQLRWHAIDMGADLLICHHPHVLQGFEVYQGVLIAHSLGNFVFDQSYAETYPSVIVKTEFDTERFRSFTVRPVFLDDMVPHAASGRLGREILDRQAEYSRELSTVVTVDPLTMQGTIQLHPENLQWTPEVFERTEPLTEDSGWWVTPPIEREGLGVLRRVLSADAPGPIEVRIGRELLWHGDFEDEGATFWDLNSSSEIYDATVAHQGARSLRVQRTSSNTGAVNTYLEGYPAALGGRDYSVMTWVKTQDATNAGLAAMLYTGRGSGQIGSFEVTAGINGTQDWTHLWRNFTIEQDAWFFNCRAHMDRPAAGESFAWFDEARLVAWEPWQPAALPLEVPYPGNQRFLQFRVGQAASSLGASWEDVQAEEGPSGVEPAPAGERAAATLHLSPPRPNPSSGLAVIEYRLPRSGPVRLTVYDVSGRRVAVLAEGVQTAGPHAAQWHAGDLPSGLYFCRLEAGGTARTEKLLRIRP